MFYGDVLDLAVVIISLYKKIKITTLPMLLLYHVLLTCDFWII